MKIEKKFLKKSLKKLKDNFLKIVRLQLIIIETLMILIFLLLFFELFDDLNTIINVRFQKNSSHQSIFNYL